MIDVTNLQEKVKVWNRACGEVFYSIPELRIKREWIKPGDMQMVSLEELQTLKFMPGGDKLLKNYLLIKDQDVCTFLSLDTDPEYFYDEKDIKVLLEQGTKDQLLDCLEFAPRGVIDLVKRMAVELKIDSSEKKKIIGEHLNVNIDAMINNNAAATDGTAETVGAEGRQRRSTPVNASVENASTVGTVSKYNVVSRG